MAEDQQLQERTEQATPKRLRDAREKGQVARSRELSAALVMSCGAAALVFLPGPLVGGMLDIMRGGLSRPGHMSLEAGLLPRALAEAVTAAVWALAPYLVILLAVAVLSPLLMGGWAFSLKPLVPKLDKLSPAKGLKRVFGPRGLVELLKAFAKAALVTGAAIALLIHWAPELMSLGATSVAEAVARTARLAGMALFLLSLSLLLIAAVDVPFQLWQHAKQLRMTRQEVREELKDTEGRPEVKSRLRSLQQETARRRMMQDVPTADVVVTNPTHYAVALRYDEHAMRAPVVVAKGVDEVAARIRHIASEHRVTLCEAPPLARALYGSTDIGAEIPPRLYVAVAQVLTWVYRVRVARTEGAHIPPQPELETIDDDEGQS